LLQTDNHASTPPLSFLQAGCPSCRPTNSVKALKANSIKALKAKSRKSKEVKLTNVIYVSIWFYKLTFWHFLKKLLGHE